MKLKRFNPASAPSHRDNKPRISVSNTGVWRANAPASEILKLKTGLTVEILCDENEPSNWFIAVAKTSGFRVSAKGDSFCWSSQVTKETLMEALQLDHPSGTMLMGTEPTKHDGLLLYPLITSSLVYRPRRSK